MAQLTTMHAGVPFYGAMRAWAMAREQRKGRRKWGHWPQWSITACRLQRQQEPPDLPLFSPVQRGSGPRCMQHRHPALPASQPPHVHGCAAAAGEAAAPCLSGHPQQVQRYYDASVEAAAHCISFQLQPLPPRRHLPHPGCPRCRRSPPCPCHAPQIPICSGIVLKTCCGLELEYDSYGKCITVCKVGRAVSSRRVLGAGPMHRLAARRA